MSPVGTVDASILPGTPTPAAPEAPHRSAVGTSAASTRPGAPNPI
eukprot:CAMPEP_0179405626 /NCGR_PEP_ID=MMETSP0799-20121207/391_1 /TAXON_ID=46947 /ORGANISM="Geminigera cryophila, Strain CCMP2564" /LENGTH=44 /DNA_ID= /DNA_START= /DNA_END= /DNA_ORIENTATION=